MNILITRFPYTSQLSGEEWHTITLAEKLRKRGHTIYLLSSCAHLLSQFQKRGFPIKKVWVGKPPVSTGTLFTFTLLLPFIKLRLFLALLSEKLIHKIDLIYSLSLTEKLIGTPIAAVLGIKVVWVEHARIGRWLKRNPYYLLYLLWNRLCVKNVIFVSEQSRKKVPCVKNALVIENGVDLKMFTPTQRGKNLSHPIPKKQTDQFWVGTITRLSRDKGIADLAQAVEKIAKTHQKLHCYIVGEGINAQEFRRDFQSKNIHFFGALPHEYVVDFLKQLDIFILPSSQHDPFGLVAAEAMAVGIPVIATNLCGITDFVQHGRHMYIVEAEQPAQLAGAIEKLMEDGQYRKILAQQGHEFARKNFDLERMVDKYEKVFVQSS